MTKIPNQKVQVLEFKRELRNAVAPMTYNELQSVDVFDWYYKCEFLRRVYDYSPYLTLNFREDTLPKRCEYGYKFIYTLLYEYMKTTRRNVNKRSVAKVVNCFVKNISRTTFYKVQTIKYNRHKSYWSNNKNSVSNKIFMELVDILKDKGLLISFSGLYGVKDYSNISSLLVSSQHLIDICTGKVEDIPKLMENCLKQLIPKYTIIRTLVGNTKVERETVKGEHMRVRELEKLMVEYNNTLERHEISVNGETLQELYFRTIFNEDLDHGGRLCDHGEFQSLPKRERKTLEIDSSPTISLDYKHLHPSILYAREGFDLRGFDPYYCEVKMPVDLEEVFEFAWENDQLDMYDCTYDPNRNLAKTALLCMINANSEESAIKAVSKSIRDDYRKRDKGTRKFLGLQKPIRVKEVVQELKRTNERISKYFFTGVGLELQNLDSQMIRYCIKSFLIDDKILLPVHDSISIKEEDEELGYTVMKEAYEDVVGTELNCRVEKE
jgi:hypothetical protein